MTLEQRTTVLKGIVLVGLFASIVTGAWMSTKAEKPAAPAAKTTTEKGPGTPGQVPDESRPIIHYRFGSDKESEQLADILKSIESPADGLAIVHFHQPGNPDSEQIADILNFIRKKHGRRVQVVRFGFVGFPIGLKTVGVSKLPHVMMIVAHRKVFEFQGLWSQERVDQKVTEILHGLVKRVGKDWRPDVPGMTPAGK